MSVIQQIRDKYARIAVVAIGVALLGFIMMDAFSGGGGLFGGQDTTVGEIDGKEIDFNDFNRQVTQATNRQQFQGEYGTMQAVNSIWQQQVMDAVMNEQYEELGLTMTDRELDILLFGPNPPQEFRQAFSDPQNPQSWDPGMVRQYYNQIKNTGTPEQKAQLDELVTYIRKQALMKKYTNLLTNSVYIPKWFLDKRNVDNSLVANAAFVSVPYTSIPDSAVTISDDEINAYLKDNRSEYELKEETRSISYVSFSAAPSAADSAKVRNQMLALKDSFQRTGNAKEFLIANNSQVQLSDNYIGKDDLNIQNKDTVFNAGKGNVVGPLVEPGAFIMTKILDVKNQPDTVKLRHILVGLNPTDAAGQPLAARDSATAKRIADSVQRVIAGGANFDSVAVKISDDPGSKFRGGVYDSITRQTPFVPEFKEFIFNNPPGSKKVVKTQFGYHYIEVLSHKGSSQVYNMAIFALPIEASSETVSDANNAATMLSGNATDEKSFNDYFEKNLKSKGYQKMVASNLKPMDFSVTGINGVARELVKAVFDGDEGDVLDPKLINNDSYVVAIITDVQEEGLPSAASVRPVVEPLLRNKKKAEQIMQQIGKPTDLNAVAAKFNQQVQTADSIRYVGGGPLGFEPKVVGAIFNPANKGKIADQPIAGNTGVYVVRTDAVYTVPVESASIEDQRRMLEMQNRQMQQSPVDLLKDRMKIKDYRAKFY